VCGVCGVCVCVCVWRALALFNDAVNFEDYTAWVITEWMSMDN